MSGDRSRNGPLSGLTMPVLPVRTTPCMTRVRQTDCIGRYGWPRPAANHWIELRPESSPRRSQLEPGLIERGTFCLNRLRRAAVIEIIPWNGSSSPEQAVPPPPSEPRDPIKLARHYQSLLDTGQFENRAALARYLGVSRARVTQVLRRLTKQRIVGSSRNTSN
jgi:hypothetical protein